MLLKKIRVLIFESFGWGTLNELDKFSIPRITKCDEPHISPAHQKGRAPQKKFKQKYKKKKIKYKQPKKKIHKKKHIINIFTLYL